MRGTRQLCQERSPAFGQKTARNPGENKGPLKLIPLEAGGSEIHGNWRRDVRKEGQSALAEHQDSLEEYFRKQPVRSAKQARAIIEQRTGLRRSLSQVRHFLKG